MNATKSTCTVALLALVAALAIGGCGSDGSGGGYGGNASNTTTSGGSGPGGGETASGGPSASGPAVVSLASVPKLGPVLVDAQGFTLYDFHKDRGAKSACYGACAKIWPPLLTSGSPRPDNGTAAAKLGTTKRSDGSVQVTYAGHPLYTYVTDEKPGEANGQDIDSFGAEWYALQGSGAEAEG